MVCLPVNAEKMIPKKIDGDARKSPALRNNQQAGVGKVAVFVGEAVDGSVHHNASEHFFWKYGGEI